MRRRTFALNYIKLLVVRRRSFGTACPRSWDNLPPVLRQLALVETRASCPRARDATFQEISVRKKELQEKLNSVARYK